MLSVIIENFRDSDGKFENDWCTCSACGCLTEMYMSYSNNNNEEPIWLCKGCLSNAIKSIDNRMVEHMKVL